MAKVLSQDEIDALLSNVSGESQESAKPEEKISLYDFKHPNLVSKEQMRLLETIHEGLCRNFGVYLSAQLRLFCEMNLIAIDQIMYSEFVMSIAPPSCIYVCDLDQPEGRLVLELNPQLGIFLVERLFGGKGDFVNKIRPVSVIEQRVMRRVIDRIAAEISKNWSPLTAFECEITRFESNPEFVQIVPSSEPVVVVSMEIKIHGNSTLLNICYPYTWISSVVSLPEVQEKILFGARKVTPEERETVESTLGYAPVPFRAVLGSSEISVRDFINLKENDVIKLNNRINQPISVYVNTLEVFKSHIGVHQGNYAVQVNTIVKEEYRNES